MNREKLRAVLSTTLKVLLVLITIAAFLLINIGIFNVIIRDDIDIVIRIILYCITIMINTVICSVILILKNNSKNADKTLDNK